MRDAGAKADIIADAMPNTEERNIEELLNGAIARALNPLRRGWSVAAEKTRVLKTAGKRPDILVRQDERPTVLIENEFMPAASVEAEIRGRLGVEFHNSNQKVEIGVALRSPKHLEHSEDLDRDIKGVEFDYALFSGAEEISRFPQSGWLTGSLADLAGFVYRAAIPADMVQAAAIVLENAVQDAARILDRAKATHPDINAAIEEILQQEGGEQTNRMAMAILVNALAFHGNLAGRGEVRTLAELLVEDGAIRRNAVFKEWQKILQIDYRPIFRVAQKILVVLSDRIAQEVLDRLTPSAEVLAAEGVLMSHDLFGGVFQRLISDRKFLATFYTRPSSAVLLANLAIPEDAPFAGGNWRDNVTDYSIADFACGTGALLSAAYRRVGELHERSGGNPAEIHPEMMAKALVGCDVMPAAVHLTASMLSSAYSNQVFEKTRLDTARFGKTGDGVHSVGSLELLDKERLLPGVFSLYTREHGSEEEEGQPQEIRWNSMNLVIMNPPFTRSAKYVHDVPNPAWAGFKATAKLQRELGNRAKKLRVNTCGSGNAGLASDFVALANKMACMNGKIAMVLPLIALAGESWKEARTLWAKEYGDMLVVTLSASGTDEYAFSADTGMGEMLFIGRQLNGRNGKIRKKRNRAIFIVLDKRPENEIEAAEIARIIRRAICGKIRRLEDGPVGGTRLMVGKTELGGMLDAPVPCGNAPWTIARMRSFSLAQTAHAVIGGRLWFPRESKNSARTIPVCLLGDFSGRGYIGRDINGVDNGKPRGPFDIAPIRSGVPDYPCLWAHDAKRETKMLVEPDSEGIVRIGMENRALEIWKTAGRVHYNTDFRFNSQPLAVAMTDKPTIGGRAWPNVNLRKREYEPAFALWGNSTLGILCYWWWSSKQQEGRGTISLSRLPDMPTLNIAELSPAQLAAARKGFNAMKHRPLLPFYRAAEDPTRAELDRVILCDVLGLPKKTLSGVGLIREKLCAEPSVCGGKK